MVGRDGIEPPPPGFPALIVARLHRPHFLRLAFSSGPRRRTGLSRPVAPCRAGWVTVSVTATRHGGPVTPGIRRITGMTENICAASSLGNARAAPMPRDPVEAGFGHRAGGAPGRPGPRRERIASPCPPPRHQLSHADGQRQGTRRPRRSRPMGEASAHRQQADPPASVAPSLAPGTVTSPPRRGRGPPRKPMAPHRFRGNWNYTMHPVQAPSPPANMIRYTCSVTTSIHR